MKREDIEKAAEDFVMQHSPSYTECFLEGAAWRINSAWHDASEVPEEGKTVLSDTGWYGMQILGPCMDQEEYGEFCKELDVTRWAYIEDLMPSGEDGL